MLERERLERVVDWARFWLGGVLADALVDGNGRDLRSWPVALEAHELLAAMVVVLELRIEEGAQISDAILLRLLDILHTPEHLLAGLLVLCLLGAQLLLAAEVLLLRLLHLGQRGVVGEAPALELLARGLVFLHLYEGALEGFEPAGCGVCGVGLLDASDALVGSAHCCWS